MEFAVHAGAASARSPPFVGKSAGRPSIAPWTADFADEVCRTGAAIPFKMQSRCDLMTSDSAAALRRAGCAEVWMGAESGSQRILDAMDKGISVADIHQARENLRTIFERAQQSLAAKDYAGAERGYLRRLARGTHRADERQQGTAGLYDDDPDGLSDLHADA